jgi:hypothetical protein
MERKRPGHTVPESARVVRGKFFAGNYLPTDSTSIVMLWTLFSILMVLWVVGLMKQPLGGFVHVLLILALLAGGTELVLAWRRSRI